MSDKKSNPASLYASDESSPAKNGSRDMEHAPPPLGSEENVKTATVFLRISSYRRRWNPRSRLKPREIEHPIRLVISGCLLCR